MSADTVHEQHGNTLYLTVWGGLVALTIFEVILAYRNFAVAAMLFLLLSLSLVKAGLIMAYFMHLRFEKRSLTLTLIPALVFCIGLLFIFFPDSMRLLNMGG